MNKEKKPYVVGITGGVGCGKSSLLGLIREKYPVVVLEADRVAKDLMAKGGATYEPLAALLGPGAMNEKGEIDKQKMADAMYADPALRKEVNRIVHPAVCQAMKDMIDEAKTDLVFIEAALLFEGKADALCDEVWYVHVPAAERLRRLSDQRGYSKEKTLSIMKTQLSEAEFMRRSDYCIRNTMPLEEVGRQVSRRVKKTMMGDHLRRNSAVHPTKVDKKAGEE